MSVIADESQGLIEPVEVSDWIEVETPAAGANVTIPLGRAYATRILALICSLTTDGNAANRFVSLDYLKGSGATYLRNAAGLVITASTTAQVFNWTPNRSVGEWAANTPVFVPLLPLWLPPGVTAQITLDNIQVGDQLSGIHAVLEYGAAQP